jgi:hypothetical protein
MLKCLTLGLRLFDDAVHLSLRNYTVFLALQSSYTGASNICAFLVVSL